MAHHGMPHHQTEQHSMLRFLEIFSSYVATSQDKIYGDIHLDRMSEMLDRMADHETASYLSKQHSASRLINSFWCPDSHLKIQNYLPAHSKPMEIHPTTLNLLHITLDVQCFFLLFSFFWIVTFPLRLLLSVVFSLGSSLFTIFDTHVDGYQY